MFSYVALFLSITFGLTAKYILDYSLYVYLPILFCRKIVKNMGSQKKGSQRCLRTVCFPKVFNISSFVLNRTIIVHTVVVDGAPDIPIADIYPNIYFCVQLNKENYAGSEQLENE